MKKVRYKKRGIWLESEKIDDYVASMVDNEGYLILNLVQSSVTDSVIRMDVYASYYTTRFYGFTIDEILKYREVPNVEVDVGINCRLAGDKIVEITVYDRGTLTLGPMKHLRYLNIEDGEVEIEKYAYFPSACCKILKDQNTKIIITIVTMTANKFSKLGSYRRDFARSLLGTLV